MSGVIRALLQVNPEQRPTCDKILKMPAVMKRLEEPREEIKVELLRTIRGDNFQTIGEQLPKPNYQPKRKHKIQKTTMEFE